MDLIVGMGTRGKELAARLTAEGALYKTWDIDDGPRMKTNDTFTNVYFCLPSSYTIMLPVLLESYKEEYGVERGINISLKGNCIVGKEVTLATE